MQTPYQRIKKVINFYYSRGVNSERVNELHRKIIAPKFKNSTYYENQFKPKDYGNHKM